MDKALAAQCVNRTPSFSFVLGPQRHHVLTTHPQANKLLKAQRETVNAALLYLRAHDSAIVHTEMCHLEQQLSIAGFRALPTLCNRKQRMGN